MNVGKSVLSFLVDMGKTVFDGIMSFGKPIFAFFGKIGTFIWDAVKATPLFRIGTIIWDAIAKTDIGGKMVKMFTSVTDFLKEKLEGIWNWVKSSLTNLLPDWIKNKLGLGGGEEKPPPESKPAESKPPASKPAESKPPAKPSAGTAVPTAGPHGEPYIVMPDGRKGFGDVKSNVFYPLIGNQLGQAEKYNQAYARAATKGPSPTTDAPKQGNNTASKQGEGRQQSQTPSNAPPQASKQVTTAPEVKVGGNVTEKDIPRLMQEHVKLADYHAKTNAQMVNLLAGMAENAKRTAAATEKTARNT
jgi:hypothetical protein